MENNMYLSKINYANDYNIRKSLLLSKFLLKTSYHFVKPIKITLTLKSFDGNEAAKSKLTIILLNFLENLTGCKAIIKSVRIMMKKGAFVNYQVMLTPAHFNFFFFFFNSFVLTNPLLKFSAKPLKLVQHHPRKLLFFLSDLDLFFDAYSRRLLPAIIIFG